MDSSTDEYFGTLGGSLMKDLLAGLQVDDNDWSIEQLEKELESYEKQPSLVQQPLPSLNAASVVVSHSQQRSSSLLPMFTQESNTTPLPPPGMGPNSTTDAWSLSLQKFTSLSLQDDFLAADSARKQTRPPPGMAALVGAEDYDIKEKQVLSPPPGLGAGIPQSAPVPPGLGIVTQPTPIPPNQELPVSVQQKNNVPQSHKMNNVGPIAGLGSSMPGNSDNSSNDVPTSATTFPITNAFLTPPAMMPPQGAVMPPLQMQGGVGLPPTAPPGVLIPGHGTIPEPGNQSAPPPLMGVPMQMPMNVPPTMATPLTGVVVGAAVATPGPAWQMPHPVPLSTSQQLPPHRSKAFCNPYPRAPPIPATALISSCMTGRDIAYVVHAILKPVLAAGSSENDYYIQYIKRRVGGPQADPINPKIVKDATHDVASRENKSKEWASEKSVLGHITKSNVARPRALIATPQPSAEQDNKEQRQRANLWKARVYCDQAYQAYQSVIDIWRSSSSNQGIPPQVQLHLVKLMKCMGIVMDNDKKVYVVSDEALKLIAKLEKGRTLISRVLEQALLPPNAVQPLLPALLDIIIALPLSSSQSSNTSSGVEEKTVGRLFQAITGVVLKLNICGKTLVECLEVALRHGKAVTCSIVRMGCLHSLLQKGAQVVPQDPSEDVKEAWGIAERKFVSGLQQGE